MIPACVCWMPCIASNRPMTKSTPNWSAGTVAGGSAAGGTADGAVDGDGGVDGDGDVDGDGVVDGDFPAGGGDGERGAGLSPRSIARTTAATTGIRESGAAAATGVRIRSTATSSPGATAVRTDMAATG